MRKALAMHMQTSGMDSYEAINAHHTLSLFLSALPPRGLKAPEAIFHFRACLYCLELVAGPTYPELANLYIKLGQMLQELHLVMPAYQCMLLGLDKARFLSDAMQEAHIAHQVRGHDM